MGLAGIVPEYFLEVLGPMSDIRAVPLTNPAIEHSVGLVAVDRDPVSPLVLAVFECANAIDIPSSTRAGIVLVRTRHVEAHHHLPLLPGANVAVLTAMAHAIVTDDMGSTGWTGGSGGQTKPGVGSRALTGSDAEDAAADQPLMATGVDLNGPPTRFPASKTPE